MNFHRKKMSSI